MRHAILVVLVGAALAVLLTDRTSAGDGFLAILVLAGLSSALPRSLALAFATLGIAMVLVVFDLVEAMGGYTAAHALALIITIVAAAAYAIVLRVRIEPAPRARRVPAAIVLCGALAGAAASFAEAPGACGASDTCPVAAPSPRHAWKTSLVETAVVVLAALAIADPRSRSYLAGIAIGATFLTCFPVAPPIVGIVWFGVIAHAHAIWRDGRRSTISAVAAVVPRHGLWSCRRARPPRPEACARAGDR